MTDSSHTRLRASAPPRNGFTRLVKRQDPPAASPAESPPSHHRFALALLSSALFAFGSAVSVNAQLGDPSPPAAEDQARFLAKNVTAAPLPAGSPRLDALRERAANLQNQQSDYLQDIASGKTHPPVMSIDAEGNTSIISYDELITPVQLASSQPIPAATPIPGDLLATSMTDPNGNTSISYSDGAGRTLAVQHPTVQLASSQQPPVQLASSQLESLTYTAHDANSNRVATRSPAGGGNGSSVTLVGEDCDFDALNRETTCADLLEQNDNTGRSRTFNAASQPVTSTDAEGKVTTMEYDVRNRLVSTTDPNNIETEKKRKKMPKKRRTASKDLSHNFA